jgi:chemotaxis protein MotB
MRRHQHAAHENHERWLVSYADFITLLFAFFVVMFATAQGDKEKARQVSASVKEALEQGQLSAAVAAVLGKGKSSSPKVVLEAPHPPESPRPTGNRHPADLARTLEILQAGLAAEIQGGKIGLRLEGRGLVISLHESAFFASGDDVVAGASLSILSRIAAEARGVSNPIRLEGHTDAVPIHNSRFRSNWELSTARAIAMMEALRDRYAIPSERMSVAGYAENAPADTNETAEGRARNRRVDLVVLSKEGEKNEPAPMGGGTAGR